MPTYDAKHIPANAVRSTLDPELARFLPSAPRLGGHEPVPYQEHGDLPAMLRALGAASPGPR